MDAMGSFLTFCWIFTLSIFSRDVSASTHYFHGAGRETEKSEEKIHSDDQRVESRGVDSETNRKILYRILTITFGTGRFLIKS